MTETIYSVKRHRQDKDCLHIMANTPKEAVELYSKLFPHYHDDLWVKLGERTDIVEEIESQLSQKDVVYVVTRYVHVYEYFQSVFSKRGWEYVSWGKTDYIVE